MSGILWCRFCRSEIFNVDITQLRDDVLLEHSFPKLNIYLKNTICMMCLNFITELHRTRYSFVSKLRNATYNLNSSRGIQNYCNTCGKVQLREDTCYNHNCSTEVLKYVFPEICLLDIRRMMFCKMCSNVIHILHKYKLLCSNLEHVLTIHPIEWISTAKIHHEWRKLLQYAYHLVRIENTNSTTQNNYFTIVIDDVFDEINERRKQKTHDDVIVIQDDDTHDDILIENRNQCIIDLTLSDDEDKYDSNKENDADVLLIINDINDTMESVNDDTSSNTDDATEEYFDEKNVDIQAEITLKSESICEVYDEVLMAPEDNTNWTISDVSSMPEESEEVFCVDNDEASLNNISHEAIHNISDNSSRSSQVIWCCYICVATFTQKGYLRRHLLAHEDPWNKFGRYECKKCPFKTKWGKSASLHKRYHLDHDSGEKFKEILGAQFIFLCPYCSIMFTVKEQILEHMKHHIVSWNEYQCIQCMYLTNNSLNLRQHYKICHYKNKKLPIPLTFPRSMD